MLASLSIKNVVLIEQLSIEFNAGLCALTGETGAGKSILLDSLGLSLGERADAGLVRHGTDQASVSASFDVDIKHPVLALIKSQDLEGDTTLILRRVLSKDGKSKAFINDQPVSIGFLKQVGEMLVEIHGQFDTQTLLNSQYHIHLLDEYAGHSDVLKKVKNSWAEWRDNQKKLDSAREAIDKARSDEAYYRASLEDLDDLSPKVGEEESLSSLRDKLMRREQIFENLVTAEKGIEDIEAMSGTIWRALEKLSDEGSLAIAAMDRVNAELQEVIAALHDISTDLENSEYSLQEIDDRLFGLKAQARKHNCSIDELPQKRDEIASVLNSIETQDSDLANLMRQVEKNRLVFEKEAQDLSQKRQKAADKLTKLIMKELPPLKLDKARFEISVEDVSEDYWNINGMNKVQFLVATNPGAVAGPLNKIASGGEMARLMLALKVVLAEVGTAGSLVFDEVDSGIGGATAAAVGERLARLASHRQILVVTHSPQVAAIATNHWIVSKAGKDKVTTNITPLKNKDERQEEIARMLSGAEITQEARAAANKLLESMSSSQKSAA